MKRAWNGFLRISLWLASIGLMAASSGIDGAYLAKLMPAGWGILGLVLNTVADLSSEVSMYWYGRLRQAGRKGLWPILAVQVVLAGYAWLFGWRQLLPILRTIEQDAAIWLSPLMAAFIPVALIGIGYVQSLLAGKHVVAKTTPKNDKVSTSVPAVAPIEPERAVKLSPVARREQALMLWMADDSISQAQMAERLGVSRQTMNKDYNVLIADGKLRRNGHGAEVN